MKYDMDQFQRGLESFHLSLSEHQLSQFIAYYELLIEKNKVMNLTSITEFEDVVEKHFLDSISICQVCDMKQNIEMIDLGTGAGFPGIPLKIVYPDRKIVLADSLYKRIHFLDDVILKLGLKEIETIHARAEELARNKSYRERFDLCVSRAVANLSSLSEYCIPFVKEGGRFISYKSGEIDEEVKNAKNAIFLLGGKIEDIYRFELYGQKRSFVIIKKDKKTSKAYPRKAGTPSKNPLH